jgi:hypothetical protein
MPITVSGTQVTYNDATVQTTAPLNGQRAQVFNSSGTFTIPTAVTALKVSIIGSGGGGTGYNSNCCGNPNSGNAAGASSVASGNQSISAMTATGGGGSISGGQGNPGTISGQAISGRFVDSPNGGQPYFYGQGGGGPGGSGGNGAGGIQYYTGLTPGANLTITRGAAGNGGAGASGIAGQPGTVGIIVIEW